MRHRVARFHNRAEHETRVIRFHERSCENRGSIARIRIVDGDEDTIENEMCAAPTGRHDERWDTGAAQDDSSDASVDARIAVCLGNGSTFLSHSLVIRPQTRRSYEREFAPVSRPRPSASPTIPLVSQNSFQLHAFLRSLLHDCNEFRRRPPRICGDMFETDPNPRENMCCGVRCNPHHEPRAYHFERASAGGIPNARQRDAVPRAD